MELRQLKYFIRSADLQNFTEAARQLFISQSTLSQQIKQLEDELGIPLFDRIGKRVRLTEAGLRFLPFARQSLRDAENGRLVINDLKGLKTGDIHIGVTYGLSSLLTPVLIDFSATYPHIKLVVDFGTSQELLDKLRSAKVDFLLSFLDVKNHESFISKRLYDSQLTLVTHNTSPYASYSSIALKDLETIPLVLPALGFHTRQFLNEALARQQVMPNIKMELNDINTLLQLVETGNWSTIMTIAAVSARHSLKTIPIKELKITSYASVTWAKEGYQKKSVTTFIDMIFAHAKKSSK